MDYFETKDCNGNGLVKIDENKYQSTITKNIYELKDGKLELIEKGDGFKGQN